MIIYWNEFKTGNILPFCNGKISKINESLRFVFPLSFSVVLVNKPYFYGKLLQSCGGKICN